MRFEVGTTVVVSFTSWLLWSSAPAQGAAAQPGRPDAAQPGWRFARLDTDGDGRISKAEAPPRMLERWDSLDTNGDGFFSQDEHAAVRGQVGPDAQNPPCGAGGNGAPRHAHRMQMPGGAPCMQHGGPGGGPHGPGLLFGALDGDDDGTLSAAEIAAASEALKTLDADGDGVLTRQETCPAAAGARARPTPEAVIERFDTNGDGLISKDEAPERMLDRWDIHDTNGDGFIDLDELTAIRQQMHDCTGDGTGDPNAKRPWGDRPGPGRGR